MNIKVAVDPEGVFGRGLVDLERSQIPFATSVALNATAKLVQASWGKQIRHKLKAPRPFTVNSPMVRYSSKKELVAEVYIRDQAKGGRPPAQYLFEQVFGGKRRTKAFETSVSDGQGLQGLVAVPGEGAAIDAHGNQSSSQLRAILKAVKSNSGANIFEILKQGAGTQPGRLRPGVYRRLKRRGKGKPGKVRILVAFVKPGRYKARLDLHRTAQTVVDRRFTQEFEKSFVAATDSAFRRAMGLPK